MFCDVKFEFDLTPMNPTDLLPLVQVHSEKLVQDHVKEPFKYLNVRLELPYIPDFRFVKKLDCQHCQLNFIPNFVFLETLNCSMNKIRELPELPSLTWLDCSNNKLKKIIHHNLRYLNASRNKLEKVKGNKLITMIVSHNKLKKLPQCDELNYLDASFNFNLTHLPFYPNITYCDMSRTNLSHLPVFIKPLERLDIRDTAIDEWSYDFSIEVNELYL